MEKAAGTVLNLGCGVQKKLGCVNVDAYGDPDVRWDLNKFPYPWDTASIDRIEMSHVLEHLADWWGAFCECSRILRIGGELDIRVPDESNSSALTYRDHLHVFSPLSFHGIQGYPPGNSEWAVEEQARVPLVLVSYHRVPKEQYNWMPNWLLGFCADHMRNFIHEQRFLFRKIGA